MRYSVAFASEVDSWKWVKRAESLGFHAAWFYDTQLLNPMFLFAWRLPRTRRAEFA